MALYDLNSKLFLDDKPENDTSLSVAEGIPVYGNPDVHEVSLQKIPTASAFSTAYDWEFVPIGNNQILIRNLLTQRVLTSAPIENPSMDPVIVECATLDTSLLPGGYIPQQIWTYNPVTCAITQNLNTNIRTLTWGGESDNRLMMTNQPNPATPRVWVLPNYTFLNPTFAGNLFYKRNLLPAGVNLLGTPPTLVQQLDGATVSFIFLNEGGMANPCTSSLANLQGGVQIATTDLKYNVIRYEGGWTGPVRDPTHTNTHRLFKLQYTGVNGNFNILTNDTARAVVRNTTDGTLSLEPNHPTTTSQANAQFIFVPNNSVVNGRKSFKIQDASSLNMTWYESQQTIVGTPNVILPEVDMKSGLSAICSAVEMDIFSLSPYMSSTLQLATIEQASQCCLKIQTTFVGSPMQFESMCTNLGLWGTTPACDNIMTQYCQTHVGAVGCSCIANATSTSTSTITTDVPIQCVNQTCAVSGYKTTAMVAQLGGPMASCGFPNCNQAMFNANTPIYLADGTQLNCNQAPAFTGFHWSAGLITMIVFGSLMLLAIIIYLVWLFRRRYSLASPASTAGTVAVAEGETRPRGKTVIDIPKPKLKVDIGATTRVD